MTPEQRKAIIHQPWSFYDARAAAKQIQQLETKGSWDLKSLPTVYIEYAEAVMSSPTAILSMAKSKILEAYELHMGRWGILD